MVSLGEFSVTQITVGFGYSELNWGLGSLCGRSGLPRANLGTRDLDYSQNGLLTVRFGCLGVSQAQNSSETELSDSLTHGLVFFNYLSRGKIKSF